MAKFTLDLKKEAGKTVILVGEREQAQIHVMIEIWDKILNRLEDKKAVLLAGIDFSKSFLLFSYQEILKSCTWLCLSDWALELHASFLSEWRMRVKTGNILSQEPEVTGGAVQSSVLGVMDHNAVI